MTDTLVAERIEANLSRLRLPRIREILDQIIHSAENKGQSYLGFLDDLLEEEVAQKEQRRIETALKISGLPFIKGIDEFDFTFQPKLDRQKVMSLFDLTFIRAKRQCPLSRSSRCRQNPPGRGIGAKSMSGGIKHLLHHHGGPDRQAEERS